MLAAIGWATLICWMPRTSPTFQSLLGLSGWGLWRATHGVPIMIGVMCRTRSLGRERPGLERVERMSRAVLERKVGYEPVGNIRLLLAYDPPELQRKRRGNGDGAGELLVVGEDLGRPR